MTRAIGYIRCSTDRQEESLAQQRTKLEAFALAKGWTLETVYVDDAISGSDLKRPGLEQLLARAAASQDVDVVLAWDRNRLARPKDPIDGMMLERRLAESGKRVVYAATGQEVDRSFTSGLIGYIEHHQNGDYRPATRCGVWWIVQSVGSGPAVRSLLAMADSSWTEARLNGLSVIWTTAVRR
jgi:hypothetical protein